MNALTKQEGGALALQEDELIQVLQSSLYPGAALPSIRMVLGYCKAALLDPMQKPVHIVPMRTKVGKDDRGYDKYENRDTVMPGIGLYRVQAARTGQYAGQDEPKFGPDVVMNYTHTKREWVEVAGKDKKQPRDTVTDKTLKYPEWCSVTVYRLVGGHRSAFTAAEYWIENYATAGRDSDAPNEMWAKRTRGQLAKCAEAQALRKGFPEIGSAPTAEEMEGKSMYADDVIEHHTPPPPALPQTYPAKDFDANLPTWRKAIADGKVTADSVIAKVQTKAPLTAEQQAAIRKTEDSHADA